MTSEFESGPALKFLPFAQQDSSSKGPQLITACIGRCVASAFSTASSSVNQSISANLYNFNSNALRASSDVMALSHARSSHIFVAVVWSFMRGTKTISAYPKSLMSTLLLRGGSASEKSQITPVFKSMSNHPVNCDGINRALSTGSSSLRRSDSGIGRVAKVNSA